MSLNEIKYQHNHLNHNQLAAKEILPFIFKKFNPNSLIDIGCGTGTWTNVAKTLGIKNIIGVDGIKADHSLFEIQADEFILHDLTTPLNLNTQFDMALCLEVAEHLPKSASNNIVDILTQHSNLILFSAAIPGQGGQFHINEQWPSYWQELFEKKGYKTYDLCRMKFWNNKNVNWWYKQNLILFAKNELKNEEQFLVKGEINSLIHPELYHKKQYKINYYEQSNILLALKLHVKSILKSLKIIK